MPGLAAEEVLEKIPPRSGKCVEVGKRNRSEAFGRLEVSGEGTARGWADAEPARRMPRDSAGHLPVVRSQVPESYSQTC